MFKNIKMKGMIDMYENFRAFSLRKGTKKRLIAKKYDKDYFADDYDHYMHKVNAYSRKEKHPRQRGVKKPVRRAYA